MATPSTSNIPHRHLRHLSALMAGVGLLASGCGGGGGGAADATPPPPPPAATTVAISGVVSDGPLQGATACYDLNDNGACDAGEPTSAATDVNGSYVVNVPIASAGQHAVLVTVPAGAIDQTTGAPIGLALTFKAPASGSSGAQTVFVSPLTTMVVAHMAATGANAVAAAAYVQAQAGISQSPLVDFGGVSTAARQASMLARLVVQTQKALATALAANLGQPDVSGAAITQADIDRAVAEAVRGALPALSSVVADPAVSGASDLQAALVAAAQDLVATQPALGAAEALALIGAAKLPQAVPSGTPVATAALRQFTYTDANNWAYRVMQSSVADNTPDSDGKLRFFDEHKQASAGVVSTWGFGTSLSRAGDLHWNGSAWIGCATGARSSQTARDARGRSTYDYCDKHEEGVSTRTALDIAGQTLVSVVSNKIRVFPGDDGGVPYASWGPANLNLLGNATFPAGSVLFYQATQPLNNALSYDVTSIVSTWDSSVALGGDARNNGPLACRQALLGSPLQRQPATLEQLVASSPGTPCIVDPGTDASGSSLNPNVWWAGTSVSMGSATDALALPAGTGNYFTTTANLRVAFGASGNGVTYYRCYVRSNGGSSRNCTSVGSGTYQIETLGDARVMTFQNLPTIAQRLNFTRVFVERGGNVYFGYRSVSGITRNTLRLNLPAANALFGQLGIAAIAPQ